MKTKTAKVQTVKGYYIPPPKPRLAAFGLAMIYAGLPFLLAMALLDVILWAIAKYGFASCYGVLCWL